MKPGGGEPVLTTRLRVIALGGIASPDSPATWITLVGMRGDALLVATVLVAA
jgi:hypothetical protein